MKGVSEAAQLLILVALVVACHAMKKNTSPKDAAAASLPAFDKEAHRGGRGLMPENTIPAMIHALDLGVTTLEMDAVITRDKQVVLSHEPFFNHVITTKQDGKWVEEQEERSLNIYQMSYAETQRYDVGKRYHPGFPEQQRIAATKPLLSDVIDAVEHHIKEKNLEPVFYNIETKSTPRTDSLFHPAPELYVQLLMEVIYRKNLGKRVIIQSFDFRTLKELHRKYPGVKTAALIEEKEKRTVDELMTSLGFKPTIISPAWKLVTPAFIEACHRRDVKIIPWTVNEKSTIDSLKALGVDGIISDYPNRFN